MHGGARKLKRKICETMFEKNEHDNISILACAIRSLAANNQGWLAGAAGGSGGTGPVSTSMVLKSVVPAYSL